MNIKNSLSVICFFCAITVTSAQENVAKFFPAAAVPSGGSENLHNLLQGYLTPIAEDFGSLSNSGWYTTAGTHNRWGFDLNVTMNSININSAAKTFAPPQLNGIYYEGGDEPLQTAYGAEGVFLIFTSKMEITTGYPSPALMVPTPEKICLSDHLLFPHCNLASGY